MQKPGNWGDFTNILCIRPDNLGDVLMTGPAIRALKNGKKDRKITLLTSSSGSGIARYIPGIDQVIEFDLPWYKHDLRAGAAMINDLTEQLKDHRFDAAVIFTVYSQSPLPTAMLCYQAGIPRVAACCRENPYGLISDWIPDEEPFYQIKHEVTRQLDLVKSLGGTVPAEEHLSLDIPPGTQEKILEKLEKLRVNIQDPWLMVHPGVSEDKRQYPPGLLTAAASMICKELGYRVLITGTAPEKTLAAAMADQIDGKAISLAGMLNLEELIGLTALSPLLIANNTGPVHIAAALGTPVIVLYALTNPQHTPWKVMHRLLPFDVPPEKRSKNIIIRFANSLSFTSPVGMPGPGDIFRAATLLLSRHRKPEPAREFFNPPPFSGQPSP
ncbi:ADP-heptose:LPS heptosyltransferase [Anseongella ginsenosidimutans]|uniref:ADP-heptose:LPS heptosyltransferase n=1 Tax=Anseongella ginsenosidimutans TaxID=496056 RepID=A0A4R3KQT3_9SPHI|nr:glycosyltransferase family 9 protein [Anseongella ginsenosidimutans]QEC52861.1 glycosyltransferase family 9 protein [Anseongella ginsenosidimutans]TCS87250.1 ADP-heptose:LPS heptosyltransferase [Anseongella ginsenosidimutans]